MARNLRGRRATGATAAAGAPSTRANRADDDAGAGAGAGAGADERATSQVTIVERPTSNADVVKIAVLVVFVAVTLYAIARELGSLVDNTLQGKTAFAVAGAAAFMLAGGLQTAATGLAFGRSAPPAKVRLTLAALLLIAILVDLGVLYATWHSHRYAGDA